MSSRSIVKVESYKEILRPLIDAEVLDENVGYHQYLRRLIVEDLKSRLSEQGTTLDDYLLLEAIKRIMKINESYFAANEVRAISKKVSILKQKYKNKTKKELDIFISTFGW